MFSFLLDGIKEFYHLKQLIQLFLAFTGLAIFLDLSDGIQKLDQEWYFRPFTMLDCKFDYTYKPIFDNLISIPPTKFGLPKLCIES